MTTMVLPAYVSSAEIQQSTRTYIYQEGKSLLHPCHFLNTEEFSIDIAGVRDDTRFCMEQTLVTGITVLTSSDELHQSEIMDRITRVLRDNLLIHNDDAYVCSMHFPSNDSFKGEELMNQSGKP
jgi:hypothetical protein